MASVESIHSAVHGASPLVCPACGGANAPDAVFCAVPACHKALGGFAYVREELKKDARWHEALADRVVAGIGKPQFWASTCSGSWAGRRSTRAFW